MKKRLLITSIVMMLVVAVALSTATYAWFTSNTRVEASSINLTAATSSAAAFGIAWTDASYGTALENVASPAANSFNPLVPATYATSGQNRTTSAVTFATATIRQEGGAEKYNGPVVSWSTASAEANAAKPYIWNNGTNNSFYIKNLSTNNTQDHLYVFANVTGVGSELVRIAIFDTDNLVGILGYTYTYTSASTASYDGAATYYKAITNGYRVDDTVTEDNFGDKKATLYTRSSTPVVAPTYYGTVTANVDVLTSNLDSALSLDLGRFDPLEAREIKVYVWLDGKHLNDDTQGEAAGIELNFDVTDPYAA